MLTSIIHFVNFNKVYWRGLAWDSDSQGKRSRVQRVNVEEIMSKSTWSLITNKVIAQFENIFESAKVVRRYMSSHDYQFWVDRQTHRPPDTPTDRQTDTLTYMYIYSNKN